MQLHIPNQIRLHKQIEKALWVSFTQLGQPLPLTKYSTLPTS